jgi:myo-inositol 2-dehydrogenase/D-chiro-inositol 1-dehydrogenase
MTSQSTPRLRYFESASGQRHITDDDRYLYAHEGARYRASVIGTGTIGQEHMRVASMLGRIDIHGIYDDSAHSMDVAAEEFAKYSKRALKHYDDLVSACNDPDIDVLFICTPNFSHIDVLDVAAQSGKPIFLEKPMATTLADAKRIIDLAGDYPTFIQVGLQYRYKAPYVEARFEALDRSVLGDIKTLSMSEYRPPFLDKVDQWNKFEEFSGGTLVEKCCHYFDMLNLFANAEPLRVYASGMQAVNFTEFEKDGKPADIDDCAKVIIDYKNGIQASFTLNMFCPNFYEELVICGTEGRLVATEYFDFQRSDSACSRVLIEHGELRASRDIDVSYTRAIEQSGHHGATYFEHIALADQLDGKPVDAATPLEGLWSMIVASAAQKSAKTRQPVMVDEYIESNKLNAVLDR